MAEYNITLMPFSRRFVCRDNETILAAALRQGINLRYGCRQGGCGTCKALAVAGDLDQSDASTFALMDFERDQGYALLCSAYPLSDVTLELADYDLSELDEAVGQIREYQAVVRDVAFVTHDIVDVQLALVEPASMNFTAGQYVEGLVPQTNEWRAYSMANPPSQSGVLEFLVKLIPDGLASSYVGNKLKLGEHVTISGPYGRFHLRKEPRPALFVAGGAGLAPILSILREMAETRDPRPSIFFYGARRRRDLFFLDELYGFENRLPDFRFVPALSETAPDDEWEGETGLITDVVARKVPDASGWQSYLCGSGPMIDAALPVLERSGIGLRNCFYDKFLSRAESISLGGATGR